MKSGKKRKIVRYPYAKERLAEFEEVQKTPCYDHLFSKRRRRSFLFLTMFFFLLTAGYGAWRCRLSYERLFRAICDFGRSVAYYFTLFFSYDVTPTINEIPDIPVERFLPFTWEEFRAKITVFPHIFCNGENCGFYLRKSSLLLSDVSKILVILLPLLFGVRAATEGAIRKRNVDYLVKSKPLKIFLRFEKKILTPIRTYIQDFILWNKGHRYSKFLLFLWMCNLNIVTVILSFFAWYFYFAKAFDFLHLYTQVVKFLLDVAVSLKSSFFLLNISLGIYLFHKTREKAAYEKLNRLEQRVQKKADSFPVSILVVAPPGVGKTTFLVNVALSKSLLFRNAALERLIKYYSYFPDFPWLRLEKKIQCQIRSREIFNLASIEAYYRCDEEIFCHSPDPKYDYGYDGKRYRTVYHDGVNEIGIAKAVETYAKLYFIYIMESSLIVSNFSIREDYLVQNCGNFILFDYDFYTHPAGAEYSHFSHILNYDTLRLGKTVTNDPHYRNSFEFGILCMTEIGKERGNALENLTVRKTAEECNVKNDLLIPKNKMTRHSAVVDNYVFVMWLLDEQRASSLGADFRECCDTIMLKASSPAKLAYPFFWVENAIYDIAKALYDRRFTAYRFSHGNKTLSAYLVKHALLALILPLGRILNRFSYKEISYIRWNLASEDNKIEEKIPLVALKVYRERFSTDTHAKFFRKRALASGFGMEDYPVYSSLQATDEELHEQNSFFIREMDMLNGEKEK